MSLFPQWESPLAFVKVELHCWSTAQANSFGQTVS